MHHTKHKGDLGVLKAQLDLFQKGFVVCIPQTEHAPFDLVACKEGKCYSFQVKYREGKNDKLEIEFRNSHADKNGTHSKSIDKTLIDFYCIYCPDNDKCYYFNPKKFNKSITIRIAESIRYPKRMNTMNWHEDFLEIPEI